MKKPNYELKAKVISNGMAKLVNQIHLTFFRQMEEDKALALTGELIEQWKPLHIETAKMYVEMFHDEFNEEYQECIRVNNATRQRNRRLKEHIENMLVSGQCIFLTLTFTDNTLERTNEDTRKRYVKRYLKEVSSQYVANIDYGSKNEREHYHAIVLCDKVDYSFWHKYGAIKGELIKVEDNASKRLSKYVNKLTNHAIKETTRRNCIIYSR